MNEELKAELANIKTGLETKTASEVKNALDAFETKMVESTKTAFETEIKAVKDALELKFAADLKVVQDHANLLDGKLQEKAVETKDVDHLTKAIADNIEAIKVVSKDKGIQTKVVGNMTTANLTGTAPKTYNFDIVTLPSQMVNIEDLARAVTAENGIYVYTRETGAEGSIGAAAEGASKNLKDYDFTAYDVTTDFIAGITRYSKKMRNNLTYIVNSIPAL